MLIVYYLHELVFLFHRIEHESFSSNESGAFVHFASVVLSDFLPFIVQCLEAIFPDVAIEHLALTSSYAVFYQLPHFDILSTGESLKDIIPCSKTPGESDNEQFIPQ